MMNSASANRSLGDLLTKGQYDAETIVHGARYYLSAITDDLPSNEMRNALVNVASAAAVDDMLRQFSADPISQEQAALALLAYGWNERGDQDLIVAALAGASGKLPIIEVGLIAISSIYALYLLTTRGVKKKVHVVEHRPDGTFTERETTEYFGVGDVLAKVAAILGGQQP